VPRPNPTLRSPREAADAVFLSPRVLDQAAFDALAGELRTLVERATEDARTLQTAAAQAHAAHQRLVEAAPSVAARLTALTEVIVGLDARSAQAGAALTRAADVASRAAAAETRLAEVAQQKLAAVEAALAAAETAAAARLEARLRDAEARLEGALARARDEVATLERRADQIAARFTALANVDLPAIAALCDRAAALAAPAGLPEAAARAERAAQTALAAARDLAAAHDRAEALRADLDRTLTTAAEASERLAAGADALRTLLGAPQGMFEPKPERKPPARSRRAAASPGERPV